MMNKKNFNADRVEWTFKECADMYKKELNAKKIMNLYQYVTSLCAFGSAFWSFFAVFVTAQILMENRGEEKKDNVSTLSLEEKTTNIQSDTTGVNGSQHILSVNKFKSRESDINIVKKDNRLKILWQPAGLLLLAAGAGALGSFYYGKKVDNIAWSAYKKREQGLSRED